jgi:hypothetical protein
MGMLLCWDYVPEERDENRRKMVFQRSVLVGLGAISAVERVFSSP